jgi:soluble lytic murein transglycosylase-like protein
MKWFYPLLFFLLSASCKAEVPSTLAERCVQHYAAHYRVPPELIAALIDVESRWNPQPVHVPPVRCLDLRSWTQR